MGCNCLRDDNSVLVDSRDMSSYEIPEDLMREMRSSVVFLGAIIGRMGKAVISSPGGCELGLRPIDLHIKAFEKMGILVEERFGFIHFKESSLKDSEIHLDFPSVGATENIMLAATRVKGKTRIILQSR